MPVSLSSLYAPTAATVATAVAGAVPTTAGITTIVQNNASSPVGGTWTNLGVVDLNGVQTTTISSLSGYKYLRFYFGYIASVGTRIQVRFNGDTAANYWCGVGNAADYQVGPGVNNFTGTNEITLCGSPVSNYRVSGILEIENSNSSIYKMTKTSSAVDYNGSAAGYLYSIGCWNSTSAISSVTFLNSYPSNFAGGSRIFCVGGN